MSPNCRTVESSLCSSFLPIPEISALGLDIIWIIVTLTFPAVYISIAFFELYFELQVSFVDSSLIACGFGFFLYIIAQKFYKAKSFLYFLVPELMLRLARFGVMRWLLLISALPILENNITSSTKTLGCVANKGYETAVVSARTIAESSYNITRENVKMINSHIKAINEVGDTFDQVIGAVSDTISDLSKAGEYCGPIDETINNTCKYVAEQMSTICSYFSSLNSCQQAYIMCDTVNNLGVCSGFSHLKGVESKIREWGETIKGEFTTNIDMKSIATPSFTPSNYEEILTNTKHKLGSKSRIYTLFYDCWKIVRSINIFFFLIGRLRRFWDFTQRNELKMHTYTTNWISMILNPFVLSGVLIIGSFMMAACTFIISDTFNEELENRTVTFRVEYNNSLTTSGGSVATFLSSYLVTEYEKADEIQHSFRLDDCVHRVLYPDLIQVPLILAIMYMGLSSYYIDRYIYEHSDYILQAIQFGILFPMF